MRTIAAVIAATSLFTSPLAVLGQPGSLDPSLSGTGTTFTHSAGAGHWGGLAVQSDGRMVVVSKGLSGPAVVHRYMPDGTLDGSFGSGGVVTLPYDLSALGVIVQPDGRILVNHRWSIVRLTAAGALDPTFGSGGIASLPTAKGYSWSYSPDFALLPSGKIIVAGSVTKMQTNHDFTIVRLNANGSPDTTFNRRGYIIDPYGSSTNEHLDINGGLAIQADGKIVITGWSNGGTVVNRLIARYNADGSIDNSFGSAGKVNMTPVLWPLGFTINPSALRIQSDGRIVVAGTATTPGNDTLLMRYHSNGTLDTSFGGGAGWVRTWYPGIDGAQDLAIQSDGKLFTTGYFHVTDATGVTRDYTVAMRFNTNGTPDAGFGPWGNGISDFGDHGPMASTTSQVPADSGHSIVIDSTGRIHIAGFVQRPDGNAITLTRFQGD
jgi:uncharacterized delta-60 repeat protein